MLSVVESTLYDGAVGARRTIPCEAVFEVYQETHDPPLESLVEGLTGN